MRYALNPALPYVQRRAMPAGLPEPGHRPTKGMPLKPEGPSFFSWGNLSFANLHRAYMIPLSRNSPISLVSNPK